jgi:hypothetical protein
VLLNARTLLNGDWLAVSDGLSTFVHGILYVLWAAGRQA